MAFFEMAFFAGKKNHQAIIISFGVDLISRSLLLGIGHLFEVMIVCLHHKAMGKTEIHRGQKNNMR